VHAYTTERTTANFDLLSVARAAPTYATVPVPSSGAEVSITDAHPLPHLSSRTYRVSLPATLATGVKLMVKLTGSNVRAWVYRAGASTPFAKLEPKADDQEVAGVGGDVLTIHVGNTNVTSESDGSFGLALRLSRVVGVVEIGYNCYGYAGDYEVDYYSYTGPSPGFGIGYYGFGSGEGAYGFDYSPSKAYTIAGGRLVVPAQPKTSTQCGLGPTWASEVEAVAANDMTVRGEKSGLSGTIRKGRSRVILKGAVIPVGTAIPNDFGWVPGERLLADP
jgi:hypothetical protein